MSERRKILGELASQNHRSGIKRKSVQNQRGKDSSGFGLLLFGSIIGLVVGANGMVPDYTGNPGDDQIIDDLLDEIEEIVVNLDNDITSIEKDLT